MAEFIQETNCPSDHCPSPVFAAARGQPGRPAIQQIKIPCFGTRDGEKHQVMNMDEEIMGRNGNDSASLNCRDTNCI